MKLINNKLFICIIILIFSFFSCKNSNNNNPLIQKNNKIILSDSLILYNPYNLNRNQKKYKNYIYTYLNVSCPSCLDEMNEWAEFSKTLMVHNCECIFILYSKDNFQFFKHLYENGDIKRNISPFYFDNKDYFLKSNSFIIKYGIGQCYMTDENNNILLSGDFIRNKELQTKLFDILKRIN